MLGFLAELNPTCTSRIQLSLSERKAAIWKMNVHRPVQPLGNINLCILSYFYLISEKRTLRAELNATGNSEVQIPRTAKIILGCDNLRDFGFFIPWGSWKCWFDCKFDHCFFRSFQTANMNIFSPSKSELFCQKWRFQAELNGTGNSKIQLFPTSQGKAGIWKLNIFRSIQILGNMNICCFSKS